MKRFEAALAAWACGAMVMIAPAGHAAFMGLSIEAITITDTTMVLRLYANFDSANDAVVNVFNVNITSTHPFVHNEPLGLPDAALLANFVPNSANLFDSWVSIGLSPQNNGGTTALDPGFDGFINGSSEIEAGSGWFNTNPPNNQGKAGADGRVELAQFAFVGSLGEFVVIEGVLSLTSTAGTFINLEVYFAPIPPSPGAVPLLGIAALAGSSRRRRGA